MAVALRGCTRGRRSRGTGCARQLTGDARMSRRAVAAATGKARNDSTWHRTRSSSELSTEPFSVTTWSISPRSTSAVARTGRESGHEGSVLYAIAITQQSPEASATVVASRNPELPAFAIGLQGPLID